MFRLDGSVIFKVEAKLPAKTLYMILCWPQKPFTEPLQALSPSMALHHQSPTILNSPQHLCLRRRVF